VPPFVVAAPNMSNVKLDLRDAVPQTDVIHLSVEGVAGSLILVVPPGWAVDSDRLGKGLGSIRNRIGAVPLAGYPVIVVSGGVGLGTFVARGERFYERWGRARRQANQRELMR
jgi:predicted oxidoreductase